MAASGGLGSRTADSTPATHHAHHADTIDDGIGHYKGNFGNMFFLWDVIFGTGLITCQYPKSYGIALYQQEEWYAQFMWPILKSKKEGSELSHGGPMVKDEVAQPVETTQLVSPGLVAIDPELKVA